MNSLITNNQLLSNYANNSIIISKTQAEILQKIKNLEQKINITHKPQTLDLNLYVSQDQFKLLDQKIINTQEQFKNIDLSQYVTFQQFKLIQDELKNTQTQLLLTQDKLKNVQEQFKNNQEQLKQFIQNYIHTTISNIINPINTLDENTNIENNNIDFLKENTSILNIPELNISNNNDDIIIEEKKAPVKKNRKTKT